MKKTIVLLLTVAFLFSTNVVKADGKEMTGTVTSHTLYQPGTTLDMDFTIDYSSPDDEYFHHYEMTFPIGITPNSATNISWASATITGQNVKWGWAGGGAYGSEDFSVNVTVDEGIYGDQLADFIIYGDTWGAPPHNVEGQVVLQTDATPPPPVPLSNWSFGIVGLLVLIYTYFKFRM